MGPHRVGLCVGVSVCHTCLLNTELSVVNVIGEKSFNVNL